MILFAIIIKNPLNISVGNNCIDMVCRDDCLSSVKGSFQQNRKLDYYVEAADDTRRQLDDAPLKTSKLQAAMLVTPAFTFIANQAFFFVVVDNRFPFLSFTDVSVSPFIDKLYHISACVQSWKCSFMHLVPDLQSKSPASYTTNTEDTLIKVLVFAFSVNY